MPARRSKTPARSTTTLMVRLDKESKDALTQAATLRKISVSDYVRVVTVGQARKEVSASSAQTIALSAAEQFAFWTALNDATKLTAAQKRLGKIMRGEA
jgi:uncharacterized protein (DUF1778 family)